MERQQEAPSLNDLVPFLSWSPPNEGEESQSLLATISQLILEYSPLEVTLQFNFICHPNFQLDNYMVPGINPHNNTLTTAFKYKNNISEKRDDLRCGPLVTLPSLSNPYAIKSVINYPRRPRKHPSRPKKKKKKKGKEEKKKEKPPPFIERKGDLLSINVPFAPGLTPKYFPKYLSHFMKDILDVYWGSYLILTDYNGCMKGVVGNGTKEIIYLTLMQMRPAPCVNMTVVDPKGTS